jgi:hypothetical protein
LSWGSNKYLISSDKTDRNQPIESSGENIKQIQTEINKQTKIIVKTTEITHGNSSH